MAWLKKANPAPFEYQKQRENYSKMLADKKRERRLIKERLIMTGESL